MRNVYEKGAKNMIVTLISKTRKKREIVRIMTEQKSWISKVIIHLIIVCIYYITV